MAPKSNEDDFFRSMEEIIKNNPEKAEKMLSQYSRKRRGSSQDSDLLKKLEENGLIKSIHSYLPPESETKRKVNSGMLFALLVIVVILVIILFGA